MLSATILSIICNGFNLGSVIQVSIGTKGVSNKKYRITTDKGEFFVKAFKGMPDSALQYIYDVESFMASKGIPAVTSISTNGRLWLVYEGTAYVVYPFITSNLTKTHSIKEYEQMGALLAKIHWASQQDTPQKLFANISTHKTKEEGIIELKRLRETILARVNIDENDQNIIDALEYKLGLTTHLDAGNLFIRDAIIHGDFHPDNLLFDQEAGEIIGVCDWEKARYGSRVHELVYAMIFSCFYRGYVYDSALKNVQAMLRGYRREYSVSNQEIELGFLAHVYYCVINTSNENSYCTQKSQHILDIVAHERHIIDLFANKKIISDILGA